MSLVLVENSVFVRFGLWVKFKSEDFIDGLVYGII